MAALSKKKPIHDACDIASNRLYLRVPGTIVGDGMSLWDGPDDLKLTFDLSVFPGSEADTYLRHIADRSKVPVR